MFFFAWGWDKGMVPLSGFHRFPIPFSLNKYPIQIPVVFLDTHTIFVENEIAESRCL